MNQGMNPYQAPTTQSLSRAPERDWKWLLFSFDGRASRSDHWKGLFLAVLGVIPFAAAIGVPIGLLGRLDSLNSGEGIMLLSGIAALLVMVPMLWVSLAIAVKRWHDRNKSGLWVLIGFIPYIGWLWALIECGCLRGTAGPNAFGPDPLD